jgi:hypothetical protein
VLLPGILVAALTWTAVKSDFRNYVNQGTGQQVVLVSYTDGIGELGRLVAELGAADYRDALDDLVIRLSYFMYFGVALDQVPSALPHAGGEIWGEALVRPFMPRLLFPEKRSINDSDLTSYYTGLRLAGVDEGTSISLGYMAEAYIDFGPVGMLVAIFALGLALGGLYRWLVSHRGARAVYGGCIASAMLIVAMPLESSILKLLPSVVLAIIGSWLLMRLLVPWLISRTRVRRDIPTGSQPVATSK